MKYLVQPLASTFLCQCPVTLALTEDTGGISWAPGAALGSARTVGVGSLLPQHLLGKNWQQTFPIEKLNMGSRR